MSGEWLNLAFAVLVFALFFGAVRSTKRRKKQSKPAPDGPPDEPYRVFTTEFDLELGAGDIERRLVAASPDYARGWFKLRKKSWAREIELADRLASEHRESFLDTLGQSGFEDLAFTLLVDQSGSMEGDPMRWAAVSCRLAAEALSERGAKVEILGFSTAGWRGGFAYQKWQNSGRPKRPGRLCAPLHIIYKDFSGESFVRSDWGVMLDPNILRENVDGEALEWAVERLRSVKARMRHLIILSDGAPVDDATIMHNGPNYLVRHLKRVISDLESSRDICVSAIGIRHSVELYYSRSSTVQDLTQLPEAVAGSLRNLAKCATVE